MANVIELKNVTVYRGDTRVFDNLSLELPQGRHTVILGPNGAGKTTLLKLLTREIYPMAREDSYLRLFGREQWSVWDLRAQLGIVSHDLQRDYLGHVRGREVVLSGFYSSVGTWKHQQFDDARQARADAVLGELGIASLQDKSFAEMSTGEQRRFLLARALVNDPQTLVLDEPTSGLDIKACFHYLDAIRALMRSGKTIVLVTHHIHEIPPETAHAILLRDGRILAQGEKRAVLTTANLQRLFDAPLRLLEDKGFYQVVPAE